MELQESNQTLQEITQDLNVKMDSISEVINGIAKKKKEELKSLPKAPHIPHAHRNPSKYDQESIVAETPL